VNGANQLAAVFLPGGYQAVRPGVRDMLEAEGSALAGERAREGGAG
jgi:hypothetical protein